MGREIYFVKASTPERCVYVCDFSPNDAKHSSHFSVLSISTQCFHKCFNTHIRYHPIFWMWVLIYLFVWSILLMCLPCKSEMLNPFLPLISYHCLRWTAWNIQDGFLHNQRWIISACNKFNFGKWLYWLDIRGMLAMLESSQ